MPGYTYPAPQPTLSGDIRQIHRLLRDPTLIARRLRTILEQRYVADALLTGRFSAVGGGVFYETGEPIATGENPRAVGPGGEYPLVAIGTGTASAAKTTKWGQDTEVYDETIARLNRNPVDRAFNQLANQSVAYVDSVAMSAVSSAVTNTANLGAALAVASAEQILTAFLSAKANIIALNQGYMPDTVVMDDLSHAIVMAKFIAAGYLPRESGNTPLMTGDFPTLQGLRWLATPNGIANNALIADTTQLGGMADEDLQSPDYSRIDGIGVEVKSTRLSGSDDRDGYRLRARRVTVPVVLEPLAARKINLAA
ncbi:hypothetical protein GCM10022215_18080 [Nocardioides fonticola]|uniref:Major capsid protein n=1 Tax=Nocardioides fonticola TaxID=450363 RepID=A0ABP7XHL9_9ACTN